MDVREKLVELPIEDAILILREEHRQRTDGYTTYLEHGGKGDPAEEVSLDALSMAISVLEKTNWISVKDRLPDKTGRYLAVKKRIAPDELGGNRTDIVILRFSVDDGFRMPTHIPDWINEEINEEVTHWMPLPDAPKGE